MVQLNFEILINAPVNKVWFALWDDHHYKKWTSAFSEGSYAISDWQQGSKVHFLNQTGSGMYSTISELVENEKMCFTHIGEIKEFQELPLDEKSQMWTGSTENYYLKEENGKTLLTVNILSLDEYKDYFSAAFPKALDLLKNNAENFTIYIEAMIQAELKDVWEKWTDPKHIVNWNFATDDWHAPYAENDLRTDGKFLNRMAAKDGSFSFDFEGTYTLVDPMNTISYSIVDGRKVKNEFQAMEGHVKLSTNFEPENHNPLTLQKMGWQAILNNFKKYVESGN